MRNRPLSTTLVAALILLALGLTACRSAYYKTREELGTEKREILTERVQKTIGELEATERSLRAAEDATEILIEREGTPLERRYKDFTEAADAVRDRDEELRQATARTRQVAADYLKDWERSDDDFTDQDLKEASVRRRQVVRERWEGLDESLRQAEASIRPALAVLGDLARFLEQSLTDDNVSSLRPQLRDLEDHVRTASADIDVALAESNSFLVATRER